MALKFIKQKKNITTGYSPGEKYVAKILYDDVIDTRKLSEMIAETSSLSRGDILSVLAQLETVIGWAVEEGNAVELGDLGKFVLGIKATAMATADEVDATTIKRVYLRFAPSVVFGKKIKDIKAKIQKLDFKGLVVNGEEEEEPTP
ncbi:MAG: HU family DNA-binding protein [Bacteroidales bacterium]